MGITLSIGWAEPGDPYDPNDLQAVEVEQQFGGGWILNPIVVNGDYPDLMKQQIGKNSQLQGFNTSRLPEFTDKEKQRINGNFLSYCYI